MFDGVVSIWVLERRVHFIKSSSSPPEGDLVDGEPFASILSQMTRETSCLWSDTKKMEGKPRLGVGSRGHLGFRMKTSR